jgi:hypothetical protein
VSQDIVTIKPGERAMDHWAVGRLIDWAAGKDGDAQTKARLKVELRDLAAELAGPSPSPVESVLADTAATAWFAFRMSEAQYAGGATSEGGMTLAQSEHAQRRTDRAHRRLMSTLKTLAAVRRLATPRVVRVNVATANGDYQPDDPTRIDGHSFGDRLCGILQGSP